MMIEALAELIEETLRKSLGPYGLDHVEVRTGEDHDGEPALFIDAILKPKASLIEAAIYNDAHGTLSDALLRHGERRFPYLFVRHPDEERAEP